MSERPWDTSWSITHEAPYKNYEIPYRCTYEILMTTMKYPTDASVRVSEIDQHITTQDILHKILEVEDKHTNFFIHVVHSMASSSRAKGEQLKWVFQMGCCYIGIENPLPTMNVHRPSHQFWMVIDLLKDMIDPHVLTLNHIYYWWLGEWISISYVHNIHVDRCIEEVFYWYLEESGYVLRLTSLKGHSNMWISVSPIMHTKKTQIMLRIAHFKSNSWTLIYLRWHFDQFISS